MTMIILGGGSSCMVEQKYQPVLQTNGIENCVSRVSWTLRVRSYKKVQRERASFRGAQNLI